MDWKITALGLAEKIRSKQIKPSEALEHYLKRIEQLNPALNAITFRRDQEARKEALAADQTLLKNGSLPPFFGVPIAIKSLTSVKGWPNTSASRVAQDQIAEVSHDVVTALQNAGFILLCHSSSPELGSLPITESKLHGVTRNPWNHNYTPGGSSGGAAVCVATGMAPIAEASDGGGSIRIPASCCSLVGLKPSRGRVRMGPERCDNGITTKGCITRDVADSAAVLDVISLPDMQAWYNAPAPLRPFAAEIGAKVERMRIGFTKKSPLGFPLEPACVEAVEKTAKALQGLGHDVFEAEPNWGPGEEFVNNFMVIWATVTTHLEPSAARPLEPHNATLRQQAMNTNVIKYHQALSELQKTSRRVSASWPRDFDVLLTPTLGQEPPKIGEIMAEIDRSPTSAFERSFRLVPFTPWFNITGQPAISLPVHISSSGLPIGAQLVGEPWGESKLLRLSSQLEKAMNWQQWQE